MESKVSKSLNVKFKTHQKAFHLIMKGWENNLQLISIYFDTPGYDEITKDTSASFTDKLSAIGGTFGLLTGFSLISGVEILYFMTKFLMSFANTKLHYKRSN